MGLFKGKAAQTVKAAMQDGDRRNGDRPPQERQEVLGVRREQQNHVCTEHCDTPCPVATRSNE